MIFEFTNEWFKTTGEANFKWLLPQLLPTKVIEIGSYEGASTCFLIDTIGAHKPLELHCIDTWLGSIEHSGDNMSDVESRFLRNTSLAKSRAPNNVELIVRKGHSSIELSRLLATNERNFEFIYVDGSHQASDVITDATLSFQLLRVGGIIGFDDYSWGMDDILMSPKLAIDSFVNIFSQKLKIVHLNQQQLYILKLSD